MPEFSIAMTAHDLTLHNLSSGKCLEKSLDQVPVGILSQLQGLTGRHKSRNFAQLIDISSNSEVFGWFSKEAVLRKEKTNTEVSSYEREHSLYDFMV